MRAAGKTRCVEVVKVVSKVREGNIFSGFPEIEAVFTPGLIGDAVPKQEGHFPSGSVCLDSCDLSSRTLMQNKSTEPRSPTIGLSSIPFQPWSGSVAVRTRPTQRPEKNSFDTWRQAPKDHSSLWTVWPRAVTEPS